MSNRRLGAKDSRTRRRLIEAAEELIHDEGYAAVSARNVAERAKLSTALVHYYFLNMDTLILDTFRHTSNKYRKLYRKALRSDRPIREIWNLNSDPYNAATMQEYIALASHRPSLQREIVDATARFRLTQVADISRILQEKGVDTDELSVMSLVMLMQTSSITLVMEDNLGIQVGHPEMHALIERQIDLIEKKCATAERNAPQQDGEDTSWFVTAAVNRDAL